MNPVDLPVRFSHLKRMAQSPAHYRESLTADRQTPAMRLGKLTHALVLGGPWVLYEGERRGKAWDTFKTAQAPDAFIVTSTEMATAQRMAESVAMHPDAEFVLGGHHEVEATWELLGRRCLGHVDVVAGLHIAELKTGQTSQPDRFERHALRMGYHAQLAWYQDGLRLSGSARNDAYIVIVESYAPFVTTIFQVTPRALEEGRKLCWLWMERLLGCEAADEWPGYCQSILPLDVAEDVELIIDGEELEVA